MSTSIKDSVRLPVLANRDRLVIRQKSAEMTKSLISSTIIVFFFYEFSGLLNSNSAPWVKAPKRGRPLSRETSKSMSATSGTIPHEKPTSHRASFRLLSRPARLHVWG